MFQNVIRFEKTSNSETASLPVWRLEIFCWGDMKKNLIKGRSLESVWSVLKKRTASRCTFSNLSLFWARQNKSHGAFGIVLFYKRDRLRGPDKIFLWRRITDTILHQILTQSQSMRFTHVFVSLLYMHTCVSSFGVICSCLESQNTNATPSISSWLGYVNTI